MRPDHTDEEVHGMADAATGAALATAAADGDQDAWNALVGQYTPLVMSVIRQYRLGHADAADVNQTLWLRVVEHLDRIRNLHALPAWIITTTRNECLRLLRSQRRTLPFDPLADSEIADGADGVDLGELIVEWERSQALRAGFAQLSEQCRELLSKLLSDPPAAYAVISRQLNIPVGSIGPTRLRCLGKLRRSPALVSYLGRGDERDAVATVGRR